MTGTYSFAGRLVAISSVHEAVHLLCREYAAEGEPEFWVTTTETDIRREAGDGFPEDYLETLAVYRKIAEEMICFDTLLFHGSAICLDGEGYLFTAKSGTGKSTHARIWREVFGDRAFMVNDDKPLLKITEEGVLVCGTPWDGKHHLSTNTMVPLRAICILERGETNKIRPISPAEALPKLLEQTYRPRDTAKFLKMLSLLDALSKNIRFYRMRCNMAPEAAITACNAMVGNKYRRQKDVQDAER